MVPPGYSRWRRPAMVYGAIGCGVAVGKGAGVFVLIAGPVGVLVTVMTTVIATTGFAVAVLVGGVFTVGVLRVGVTAVSQLVNKMRLKNKPSINRTGEFKTIGRS